MYCTTLEGNAIRTANRIFSELKLAAELATEIYTEIKPYVMYTAAVFVALAHLAYDLGKLAGADGRKEAFIKQSAKAAAHTVYFTKTKVIPAAVATVAAVVAATTKPQVQLNNADSIEIFSEVPNHQPPAVTKSHSPIAAIAAYVAENAEALTIRELKALAKQFSLKGYSSLTKAELIEKLGLR